MKWEQVKLGDISSSIQPGPFGTQLHNSDYTDTGTPIIMPKDMIDGKVAHEKLVYVSDEHIQRLSRHQAHIGDIIVARKGDVRKCVYITSNEEGWLTGSDCLKVSLEHNCCFAKFVYYQLKSPFMGKWLEKISIGATMPSINTGLLSSIELSLPDIETQHRIASILSAYDDLIENNQKQIKLLEEAAQRLYKEWFVDLRFPNYENTPVVDGVPEGWEKKTILDMSAVLRRGISPKYNESGKYTVINQKCIRQTIMDIKESRKQEKEYASDMNLKDSDIVICSTGSGTLGRVGQVFGDYPDTSFDSHVTLIRAKNAINVQFLFWALKNLQPLLMTLGQGSTNQLELPKRVIESYEIICPTDELIKNFQFIVQPIHDKITSLVEIIKNATEARDRLLPKLMSGELEV